MQCDTHEIKCAKCMRKNTCEVYPSTSPRRLQWIAIDCKRNRLQQKEDHFKNSDELISNSMETCPTTMCFEEGRHLLRCSGEIGSSTCSPDSWCRRFFIETAARKSDRSFIGPFLPDLFKVRYHIVLGIFSFPLE